MSSQGSGRRFPALTAADFQFDDDLAERVRPFVVDGRSVYGFGHEWDPAQFAAEVNGFARVGTGFGRADVRREWAVVTGFNPVRLTVVSVADGGSGAVPVTVIRGRYPVEEVA